MQRCRYLAALCIKTYLINQRLIFLANRADMGRYKIKQIITNNSVKHAALIFIANLYTEF